MVAHFEKAYRISRTARLLEAFAVFLLRGYSEILVLKKLEDRDLFPPMALFSLAAKPFVLKKPLDR